MEWSFSFLSASLTNVKQLLFLSCEFLILRTYLLSVNGGYVLLAVMALVNPFNLFIWETLLESIWINKTCFYQNKMNRKLEDEIRKSNIRIIRIFSNEKKEHGGITKII